MGRLTGVVRVLVSKATKKDIHNFWFLITVGIFFVLVAIAYSIMRRGSVDIELTTSLQPVIEVSPMPPPENAE